MNSRTFITLISRKQARIGKVFIHRGTGSVCEECNFFRVCIGNLEVNRVYEITGLRDKYLPCRLLNTEMQVIEVKQSNIETSIPAKLAVEGATIIFETPKCRFEECMKSELCFPEGLKDGDYCKIIKVMGNVQCPSNFFLKTVLLLPSFRQKPQ